MFVQVFQHFIYFFFFLFNVAFFFFIRYTRRKFLKKYTIVLFILQIRYAQLKKAQESLISNLETCVSKRGRIFDDVLLKDKKESDTLKEQQKMLRHISILKNKNLKLREVSW